jgi:lysyl-tRNA synthetase class I
MLDINLKIVLEKDFKDYEKEKNKYFEKKRKIRAGVVALILVSGPEEHKYQVVYDTNFVLALDSKYFDNYKNARSFLLSTLIQMRHELGCENILFYDQQYCANYYS